MDVNSCVCSNINTELSHYIEDDFEHFLCYSNLHGESVKTKDLLLLAFKAARPNGCLHTKV